MQMRDVSFPLKRQWQHKSKLGEPKEKKSNNNIKAAAPWASIAVGKGEVEYADKKKSLL